MSKATQKMRAVQLVGILILAGLFYITHTWWGSVYLLLGAMVGLIGIWIDESYKVVHSLFFVLVLIPLSIFVASSTGNTIGQGLVSALMMALAVEMMFVSSRTEVFDQHFPSGGKPLTSKEISYGIGIMSVCTLVVCAITVL